jgi:HAD superfamily hydrolase (TIGR01509 family)
LLATCDEFDVDISDLPAETFRGVHMLDVWGKLRPRFPPQLEREVWLAFVERRYVENVADLTPMPEALATVRALAARGIAQACVSNSGRVIVDANINALGIREHIAFSISLDDVSAGKPDPEPFLLAVQRFGLPAGAVLAVEDSDTGAQSARAAGLVVARYAPDGSRAGGGDYWIATLSGVLRLFDL